MVCPTLAEIVRQLHNFFFCIRINGMFLQSIWWCDEGDVDGKSSLSFCLEEHDSLVCLEELGGIFAVIHFVGYLERTSYMESNNLPGLWPVALGVRLSMWLWRCWTQRIDHTHLFQMCKPVSVTGKLLKEEHRQLHFPQYPLWLVLLGLHALELPCQLPDTSCFSIFPLFHFLPLQSLSLWERCSPTFSAQCKFLVISSNIINLYLPAGWTETLCSHKYNAFCLIECSRTCLVFASCLLSVLLNVFFFLCLFIF